MTNCWVGQVKWPRKQYSSRYDPTFTVEWANSLATFQMGNETINGNQIDICSTPRICQKLKYIMGIDFDLMAEGFQPCITSCSQWKTMNEIVFLLHCAVKNMVISPLQLPCKIEDQEDGSNPIPDNGNDMIVPISNTIMNFETILALAQEEYDFILKTGWETTVLDTSDTSQYWICCTCMDDLNVLGYPSTNDALSNGINQEIY